MFDPYLIVFILSIGVVAGFLAGLLGIGGGIVLVPGLYYLFLWSGYDPQYLMHLAVGTSLAVIIPTGLSSIRAHWTRGAVRLDIMSKIGPGILVGTALGTIIAGYLSGEDIKFVFAIAIACLATIMIIDPARFKVWSEMPHIAISSGAGTVIGTLSVLIGIGGATLSVPFMRFSNIKMTDAVGTASALGLLISVPGAAGFIILGYLSLNPEVAATLPPYSLGYVSGLAWVLIVPTTILMAPIGAKVAHSVSLNMLRYIFATFMVIVSLKMAMDVISFS